MNKELIHNKEELDEFFEENNYFYYDIKLPEQYPCIVCSIEYFTPSGDHMYYKYVYKSDFDE